MPNGEGIKMLKIYPIPKGEPVSADFTVTLNGQAAECYTARVSAIPFNRVWPGSQRPIEQTELASFIYFSMDEPVEFTARFAEDFEEAVVRPLSRGIKAEKNGREVSFVIDKPGQITLELDGFHRALHIFANPIFDFGVKAGDENVIYFGPGLHEPKYIALKSGQTLFIDAGAVVKAAVYTEDSVNVRIVGEGILDNSWEARDSAECVHSPNGCIKLFRAKNIEIKGIICRDSSVWTATVFNSDNIIFDNVKTIGMWRYNSDGIDLVNSANCTIKDCFLRNFDDVVVLKGLKGWDTRNVENIHVTGCVIWCDWGRGLEIGAETCADEYRNIIFEDCDLIHGAHMQMDLQNGDRARVHDLIFDNIRVEYSRYTLEPVYQNSDDMVFVPREGYMPQLFFAQLYNGMWSQDYLYGENYNIKFRNIYVQIDEGLPMPPSTLVGVNAEHQTHDISIEKLYINGKRLESLSELPMQQNEYSYNITLS